MAKEAPVMLGLKDLYACVWLVIITIMAAQAASQVNLYLFLLGVHFPSQILTLVQGNFISCFAFKKYSSLDI